MSNNPRFFEQRLPPEELAAVEPEWAVCRGQSLADCKFDEKAATSDCERSELKLTTDEGPSGVTIPSLVGGGGLAWENMLLQGLASFLADRSQQEVISWFFETFAKQLCEGSAAELFKQTCALIKPESFGTSAATPGGLFTSALRADLEALPFSALFLAAGTDCQQDAECNAQRGALQDALAAGFDRAKTGVSILEVLGAFGLRAGDSAKVECQSKEKHEVELWQVAAYFCDKNKDKPRFECVLGIAGTIAVNSGDLDKGHDFEGNPEEWAKQMVGAGKLLELIGMVWVDARQLEAGGAVRAIAFAGDAILRINQLTSIWREQPAFTPTELLSRAGAMLSVFTEVVTAGGKLTQTRGSEKGLSSADLSLIRALSSAVSKVFIGDYPRALNEVLSVSGKGQKTDWLPPQVQKFASLVADLAMAKDAQSVQALLQAQAAPVGSWRLKHGGVHISISGMVGIMGGGEVTLSATPTPGWSAGLNAQLGIDFVGPLGSGTGPSLGLFLSVLDVGQLTWARLNTAATGAQPQSEPEVGFLQVLSPGAYVEFAPGRSPFTILAGVSVAPLLRTVIVGDTTQQVTVVRFGLSLAIDLTLFPLYGGPTK